MAQDEKIYMVAVMVEDDGSLAECAAIKHEGKLWLVPQWRDNPTEQTTKPERIICLDGQPYQPGGKIGDKSFDYLLNRPVSTAVLYGPSPSQEKGGFVVEMLPNITFQRLIGPLH